MNNIRVRFKLKCDLDHRFLHVTLRRRKFVDCVIIIVGNNIIVMTREHCLWPADSSSCALVTSSHVTRHLFTRHSSPFHSSLVTHHHHRSTGCRRHPRVLTRARQMRCIHPLSFSLFETIFDDLIQCFLNCWNHGTPNN